MLKINFGNIRTTIDLYRYIQNILYRKVFLLVDRFYGASFVIRSQFGTLVKGNLFVFFFIMGISTDQPENYFYRYHFFAPLILLLIGI